MNKGRCIINYCGNKYPESKKFFQNIDSSFLDKYDTIYEVFGGSFGFSRYCYYNLGLKDKKYIVNDVDKDIITLLKFIKKKVLNKSIDKFVKKYNDVMDYLVLNCNYEGHPRLLNHKKTKTYIDTIKHKKLKQILLLNLFRGGRTTVSHKKNIDFDIFKNIEFINKDCHDLEFKKDDKILYYLDPPYLVSDNTEYCKFGSNNNIYKFIDKMLKEYKSIFVHSYFFLIDEYYKDFHRFSYKKTYGSGNKTEHHIYGSF